MATHVVAVVAVDAAVEGCTIVCRGCERCCDGFGFGGGSAPGGNSGNASRRKTNHAVGNQLF